MSDCHSLPRLLGCLRSTKPHTAYTNHLYLHSFYYNVCKSFARNPFRNLMPSFSETFLKCPSRPNAEKQADEHGNKKRSRWERHVLRRNGGNPTDESVAPLVTSAVQIESAMLYAHSLNGESRNLITFRQFSTRLPGSSCRKLPSAEAVFVSCCRTLLNQLAQHIAGRYF
jgi:hypothetical protein